MQQIVGCPKLVPLCPFPKLAPLSPFPKLAPLSPVPKLAPLSPFPKLAPLSPVPKLAPPKHLQRPCHISFVHCHSIHTIPIRFLHLTFTYTWVLHSYTWCLIKSQYILLFWALWFFVLTFIGAERDWVAAKWTRHPALPTRWASHFVGVTSGGPSPSAGGAWRVCFQQREAHRGRPLQAPAGYYCCTCASSKHPSHLAIPFSKLHTQWIMCAQRAHAHAFAA